MSTCKAVTIAEARLAITHDDPGDATAHSVASGVADVEAAMLSRGGDQTRGSSVRASR